MLVMESLAVVDQNEMMFDESIQLRTLTATAPVDHK